MSQDGETLDDGGHPPAPVAAPADREVLHRDLAQLLTTLSIALHRRAMYPPGHPSLVPVLEGLSRWMHDEVKGTRTLPLVEAEAIIRSLSVAMHGDRRLVLPLLRLKEFDQYTTTHSLNVAVLAMGLAEFLGLSSREVRGFGIAGLLHDLGKVRIPLEILTKPGRLTDDERRVMDRHPVDGARVILQSEEHLDVAAVVAYEHHIMIDGGGYPRTRFRRECHPASVLVHVCDVYDALRTNRPYRDAWPQEKTVAYLRERAGQEFDPEVVDAFGRMMVQWESRLAVLGGEDEAVPAGAGDAG